MNALVIVKFYPACEHFVGMVQIGEGILTTDNALDDAVIRFDVRVLFWGCRSCEAAACSIPVVLN